LLHVFVVAVKIMQTQDVIGRNLGKLSTCFAILEGLNNLQCAIAHSVRIPAILHLDNNKAAEAAY